MGTPTGGRSSLIDPKQLAAAAAVLADRKKGVDIRVYDVAEHIKVADYFVLVSGLSRPHVRAIFDEIHATLKAAGERHSRVEGADLGWWVLMDYMDVVVHVLQPEAREYYELDGLYAECPLLDYTRVPLPDLAPAPSARAAEA
jgi:ribosome-associated protein